MPFITLVTTLFFFFFLAFSHNLKLGSDNLAFGVSLSTWTEFDKQEYRLKGQLFLNTNPAPVPRLTVSLVAKNYPLKMVSRSFTFRFPPLGGRLTLSLGFYWPNHEDFLVNLMIGVPETGWLIRSFDLGKENLTCVWSDLVRNKIDEHPVLNDKKFSFFNPHGAAIIW